MAFLPKSDWTAGGNSARAEMAGKRHSGQTITRAEKAAGKGGAPGVGIVRKRKIIYNGYYYIYN